MLDVQHLKGNLEKDCMSISLVVLLGKALNRIASTVEWLDW